MRRAKSLKLNWNPQSGHNRRIASDQKSCRTRCKFHRWSFSKKIRKHRSNHSRPCYWPSSGWGDPRRRCPKRNRHCKGSRARSWWGQKIFTHIFKDFNDWGLWSKTNKILLAYEVNTQTQCIVQSEGLLHRRLEWANLICMGSVLEALREWSRWISPFPISASPQRVFPIWHLMSWLWINL